MNLNDIRARLQQMNRGNKKNDLWKPKDKKTEVRMLPYPHGTDPFVEVVFHYNVAEGGIVCPRGNFGKDCEICDFCDVLKSWNDAAGNEKPEKERKEDFEIFKKIQPKSKVYIPIVVRGKESDGPKFWGISPTVAQQIVELIDGDRMSECGIDPSDSDNALSVLISTTKAYDLIVTMKKPGEDGNNKTFPDISVQGKIKASTLCQDKELREKILSGVKDIFEVYPEMSSDEVSRVFKKFAGNARALSSDDAGDGDDEKYAAPSAGTDKAALAGTKSIDEAFGELLAK